MSPLQKKMLDLEFIVSDELFPRHSEELSGANANFGECEREMATVCYDKPFSLFPEKFQGKEQSLTAPLEQRRQAGLLEVQAQAPAPFWGTLDNELSFQLELNCTIPR